MTGCRLERRGEPVGKARPADGHALHGITQIAGENRGAELQEFPVFIRRAVVGRPAPVRPRPVLQDLQLGRGPGIGIGEQVGADHPRRALTTGIKHVGIGRQRTEGAVARRSPGNAVLRHHAALVLIGRQVRQPGAKRPRPVRVLLAVRQAGGAKKAVHQVFGTSERAMSGRAPVRSRRFAFSMSSRICCSIPPHVISRESSTRKGADWTRAA